MLFIGYHYDSFVIITPVHWSIEDIKSIIPTSYYHIELIINVVSTKAVWWKVGQWEIQWIHTLYSKKSYANNPLWTRKESKFSAASSKVKSCRLEIDKLPTNWMQFIKTPGSCLCLKFQNRKSLPSKKKYLKFQEKLVKINISLNVSIYFYFYDIKYRKVWKNQFNPIYSYHLSYWPFR